MRRGVGFDVGKGSVTNLTAACTAVVFRPSGFCKIRSATKRRCWDVMEVMVIAIDGASSRRLAGVQRG